MFLPEDNLDDLVDDLVLLTIRDLNTRPRQATTLYCIYAQLLLPKTDNLSTNDAVNRLTAAIKRLIDGGLVVVRSVVDETSPNRVDASYVAADLLTQVASAAQ